ncbi:multidrug resistance-associated protein 8 [Artemisia annua]|uniref:Multidrug resistance-associated protein 8 n=1 Tax=Artemisia annua TaxID=35608 RepID=A0A2U1LIJ1_ARTAN|nr:multidrug resistance-associated protein 8 [Artemisia annua]
MISRRHKAKLNYVIFSGGKKTEIVGRTVSGKSTLIQTLFCLVEPTAGQILIDGVNLRLESLAKKIRDTVEVTVSPIVKLVEATEKETMSTRLHRNGGSYGYREAGVFFRGVWSMIGTKLYMTGKIIVAVSLNEGTIIVNEGHRRSDVEEIKLYCQGKFLRKKDGKKGKNILTLEEQEIVIDEASYSLHVCFMN